MAEKIRGVIDKNEIVHERIQNTRNNSADVLNQFQRRGLPTFKILVEN